MSSQYPQPLGPAPSGKVRIPRLEKREEPPPGSPGNSKPSRVSRACLGCRARKIKCNGATPTCFNCIGNLTPCVYASSRKDRLKTATTQNQDMLNVLRGLRERVSETDRVVIENLLMNATDDVADAATSIQKSPEKQHTPTHSLDEETGGATMSTKAGSGQNLDLVDEDFLSNEQSRATEFLGKNSEIHWLRQLNHEVETTHGTKSSQVDPFVPARETAKADDERTDGMRRRYEKTQNPSLHTSNFNFYLDDENVDMEFVVDPFELPPFEVAERLVKAYIDCVQNSFPILIKKTFVNTFYHYYAFLRRGTPYKLPQKWQAMLNLVFAIGAVYSHLIEAEWRADERDHVIYTSRALSLGFKDPWWFSRPDLPQMQIAALLAFNYMAIGHINRSWVIIGMALRIGYVLGIHVRNESQPVTAAKEEILSRIWWAVYVLEQIVSAATGRPSVGAERHSSVPLPLPLAAGEIDDTIITSRFGTQLRPIRVRRSSSSGTSSASSSRLAFPNPDNSSTDPTNSGSYLKNTVKISEIAQRTLISIYSSSAASRSWGSIQRAIITLREDLESWAASLPPGLNFFQHTDNHGYERERKILEIYYYSAKILIARPCLCRLDRSIENQTPRSNDFNQQNAMTCVSSAKAIAHLLPDPFDNHRALLYRLGPWWSIVHYIMQALVVLLLEMCYEAVHSPLVRNELLPSLMKLMRWLRIMRENNEMAKRAYSISFKLLQKLSVRANIDIAELLGEGASLPFPKSSHPHPYAQAFFNARAGFTDHLPHEQSNPFDAVPNSRREFHNVSLYSDSTEPSNFIPGFPENAFQSHDVFTNLFVTSFDEQNLLPISDSDLYMEHYGHDEGQFS